MKRRLVVPLVGLAISLALPTYAQQKDLADPQTTQKILASVKAFDEADMNNDAAAVAALFTRDAVFVAPGGLSPVGKLFRNGIQTFTSGGTPKTAFTRSTGMPFT
jgi:ketosteroid isomerase-like protein